MNEILENKIRKNVSTIGTTALASRQNDLAIELDEEEKQIIKDIDNGLYSQITDKKKIAKYASYADNYLKNKNKKKKVTIRIAENVLNTIKNMSLENGINYQTYINIVLNNVVNGKINIQI